ncbi:DUF429 domain-containing protein [Pseudoxanthomonas kaohsiungensis]|uniref:DUF429 domain-containing protein n=1 Tax=Pseudoxanthomonas kaohsiungensis TaxID=283923 RepID=A0ABW3LY89_9GAMM|nr:DUF429 domain-containing protein [Pseudoxanthomonas kaohsiungensis]
MVRPGRSSRQTVVSSTRSWPGCSPNSSPSSTWTPGNRGAITAALRRRDGSFQEITAPQAADFPQAQAEILDWQAHHSPQSTIILIDQPTIVVNGSGQRPVENIVCASVSRRRGGMQPANTARAEMFGHAAPVWRFLGQFGGAANPLAPEPRTVSVLETYPVLAMIALGWVREDSRPHGRLPKYNPERRKTFSIHDWQYVCQSAAVFFRATGLSDTAAWIDGIGRKEKPNKSDQDRLDACLCLLVAVHVAEGRTCLMVGDVEHGYIIAPHCPTLRTELESRCTASARDPSAWVRVIGTTAAKPGPGS